MQPGALARNLLILISVVVIALGASIAGAGPTTSSTYTVVAGDTLGSIGDSLGIPAAGLPDWIDGVVEVNDLDDPDTLSIGQKLTLPKASLKNSTTLESYTVKQGDTLGSIADDRGVDDLTTWIAEVVEINELASPDILSIGKVLKLPPLETATATSATTSTATPGATATPTVKEDFPSGKTYTIKEGDTLLGIATSLNVPDDKLPKWMTLALEMNGLEATSVLKVGQQLLVPVVEVSTGSTGTSTTDDNATDEEDTDENADEETELSFSATCFHPVSPGDTWESIARMWRIPAAQQEAWIQEILERNNMTRNVLPVGIGLRVPCG